MAKRIVRLGHFYFSESGDRHLVFDRRPGIVTMRPDRAGVCKADHVEVPIGELTLFWTLDEQNVGSREVATVEVAHG